MSLDTLVNVTITTQTQSVSRAGFGTPLIAAAGVPFAGARTRQYGSLTEMTDDGFTVNDPAYLAATALVAQNPKVPAWKVGRRDLPYTQAVRFTPTDLTAGLVYTVIVKEADGTETTASYTVLGGDAVLDITAALQPLLDAVPDLTATDNATDVSVVATAGLLFGFLVNKELTFKDETPDPGIATDLAAIVADDGDWYGLILDSSSEAEILAAAAWTEAEVRLLIAATADADVKTGSSTDVMSDVQAAAYARTAVIYSENARAFADAAWMGKQFPKTPGSTNWAFKTLAGITVSNLTDGEQAAILGKNGNHYVAIAGVNHTFDGKSGSGEFLDITRFVDALRAGLQEDVFAVLVNNDKIPFTDAGIAVMIGTVKARLQTGILQGGLAADPAPVVTAPKAADVSDANKIARTLPDVNFTATLAGAINRVVINGVISV